MRVRTLATCLLFLVAANAQAYRFSAWIPAWDSAAVTSVQQQGDHLDESNPGWYTMTSTGGVAKVWNAEDPTLRAAMTGSSLIPMIQNYINGRFDGAAVATIIADPAKREAHAETLTQLVIANAFDGIDIDYEAVPTTSRADFTAFITVLAEKLHRAGKKLSVTVHPKTSDSQNWNGPGSQDWPRLGAVADSIKIMAYDYHWSTSDAGAITPLDWLEKVTAYAVSTIPDSKVMIGLPWYGYDWVGRTGKGVVYTQAMSIARANNATITRDVNGEPTFTYSDHVVYFQDAESYARKVETLTRKYPSLGGFAHWRVGGEDPAMWDRIATYSGTGGSPATQPAPDFTISGSDKISVLRGGSASSQYGTVAINGFSGTVSTSVTELDSFAGTARFSASSFTSGGSVTLQVIADKSAKAGLYRLKVRFTSGAIVEDKIVTLEIIAPVRTRSASRS